MVDKVSEFTCNRLPNRFRMSRWCFRRTVQKFIFSTLILMMPSPWNAAKSSLNKILPANKSEATEENDNNTDPSQVLAGEKDTGEVVCSSLQRSIQVDGGNEEPYKMPPEDTDQLEGIREDLNLFESQVLPLQPPTDSSLSQERTTEKDCKFDFVFLSRLGRGAFAVTFLVENQLDKQQFALKMISVNTSDSSFKDLLLSCSLYETHIMEGLKHPTIIEFFTSFKSDKYHSILMEYFDGVTLSELKKQHRKLSSSLTMHIAKQLVEGLQYLRSERIVHGDLKLDNIMINELGQVKIIDFGSARKVLDEESLTAESISNEKKGTLDYCPPEFIESDRIEKTHFTSDYWSLVLFVDAGLHSLLFDGRNASFLLQSAATNSEIHHRGRNR